MTLQQGLDQLNRLLDPYSWFDEAVIEGYRYIVYVFEMGSHVDPHIPDTIAGHQVLVHYANAKPGGTSYVNTVNASSLKTYVPGDDLERETDQSSHEEHDMLPLYQALDQLDVQCGPYILSDLLAEICDGKEALTNLRTRYPKAYQQLAVLYLEYGFKAIDDYLGN
jgi:hypothetical protein